MTRYLVLPIRGKDLFLAKNVAVMVVVAVQLMLLLAIGAWQSGFMQLGAEIVVAIVLVLAHLAWGNVVSVFEPRRAEPYRFASAGDPLTASVSALIGSAPGVAVMVLLRSDSRVMALAIAAIVLLTMAASTARCDTPEGASSVESRSSATVWRDRHEGRVQGASHNHALRQPGLASVRPAS